MKMHIELYMFTFTDMKKTSAEASKLTLVSVVMFFGFINVNNDEHSF